MAQEATEKKCLACGRDHTQTPLITLDYRETTFWICPQHLPVLIHDPQRLTGMLPGAEDMEPAEHQD